MEWFRDTFCSGNPARSSVLDIGSMSYGGHDTHRSLFTEEKHFNYCGLDMAPGPNVDIVVKHPYRWSEIADNAYDIVISANAFQHIEFPWLTVQEIARTVRKGGLVCLIAPALYCYKRFPVTCYGYLPDGMVALCRWTGLEVLHVTTNMAPPPPPIKTRQWYGDLWDTLLVARKPEERNAIDVDTYECVPAELQKYDSGFIPLQRQPYYCSYRVKQILKKIIQIIRLIKG
jgi:SAM-dependent methyltransferase